MQQKVSIQPETVEDSLNLQLKNSSPTSSKRKPLFHRKAIGILVLAISSFSAVIGTSLMPLNNASFEAIASQAPKMPWPSSVIGPVTQTMHGSRGRALDIGLSAGTPVLAPEDVQVVWQCIARGTRNHRAIQLRNSRNQVYWLIHVSTDSVKSSYQQGEQIGVVAGDYPNDSNCAISRGQHLHMELPSSPFSIDGYTLSASTPLGARLRSTNSTNTSSPGNVFASPVYSRLSISPSVLNLEVSASNLNGRRVYVQMWRTSAYGYSEREWNVSGIVSGNRIVFQDLDGPGNTFSGVTYYTVASLEPIPSGTAKRQRTSCFTATGGKQLCDAARR